MRMILKLLTVEVVGDKMSRRILQDDGVFSAPREMAAQSTHGYFREDPMVCKQGGS